MKKKPPHPKKPVAKEDPSRIISLMGRSKYNKAAFNAAQLKAMK